MEAGPKWPAFSALARVCFGFWMGILLYRLNKGAKPALFIPWALLILLIPLFFIEFRDNRQVIYELVCAIVILPIIVAIGAARDPVAGIRLFSVLGLTSYAVYVLHKPLVIAAFSALKLADIPLEKVAPWAGLGFVTAVVVGSWIADRIYDAPVRRWLTARLAARRRPPAASQSQRVA